MFYLKARLLKTDFSLIHIQNVTSLELNLKDSLLYLLPMGTSLRKALLFDKRRYQTWRVRMFRDSKVELNKASLKTVSQFHGKLVHIGLVRLTRFFLL